MTHWLRRCQECGNTQSDTPPPTATQSAYDKWAEHKCQRCKSIALDYGRREQPDILAISLDDGLENLHNAFKAIFGE